MYSNVELSNVLKIVAADRSDITSGGQTLKILDFTSEKVWLFAHGTMEYQQIIVVTDL